MALDFSALLQKLEELDTLVKTDWKSDEDLYQKLILIKPLCKNRLNSVYANLLLLSDITQIQNQLNTLVAHINYSRTGNTVSVSSITNTINSIMQIIGKIPLAGEGETSTTLAKAIDDFSQKNADVLLSIAREKDKLAHEVELLKQNIDILKKDVDNKSKVVISLTTGFQNQFYAAQEKRSAQFADTQKENEDLFNEETKVLSGKANTLLNEMSDIRNKTEKIYGIIGKASITGEQKNYANKAKNMAHWLQGASLIIMITVVVTLFIILYKDLDDITVSNFIYRFSMGSIFLLPAFFLANEGKKQREKENRYRELEIKMSAITPYFLEISDGASKDNENLPEKDRVKLELAQKLLSPSKLPTDKSVVLPPEIVELMKALIESTNKTIDRNRKHEDG